MGNVEGAVAITDAGVVLIGGSNLLFKPDDGLKEKKIYLRLQYSFGD